MSENPYPKLKRPIARLKDDAKKLKKALNISQNEALNIIATQHHYPDWQTLDFYNTPRKSIKPKTKPQKVTYPIIGEDLIHHNREILAKLGLDHSDLIITATGIKKSIMDAVAPLREYFKLNHYHDYGLQQQGEKILQPAKLITATSIIDTQVSLYRPNTKKGDPRIWIYQLKEHVQPNDILALVLVKGLLYVFNISRIDLNTHLTLLNQFVHQVDEAAFELLDKLKAIAKLGPLKAVKSGDTAIGMTIEHALGISANSSKNPDYKGIELKSAREKAKAQKTRSTIFAQVASWDISPLKSSGAIVDKYGYMREDDLKLYCSISTKTINSQGLSFEYQETKDLLVEKHHIDGEVAVWKGSILRQRLLEKHKETFWIKAESIEIDGTEHFILKSVIHTKNPLVGQLMQLLADGIITMDHLIKRKNGTGNATEKGPLFKINPKHLDLLFPEQKEYSLE
ncbi:MvaI/BcnI restriction endonuclease family protein [Acinetobacter calcoaceticus]|uniref:MvaI/BcnI family restriction endonuclease n=1 Tax=Acinetobacter calcoaceticus TaxID=471 RepID=UPI001967EEE4|nr:MvaI/BcnI family restriction endonuclease [Acinetobacter calcoaceticus]QSB54970.1 MvaI/BcnI restriction endonuclease family protein [Acinetobacter calcoaceticus]